MDLSQCCFELLKAGDMDGLGRLLKESPDAAEAKSADGVSLLMQVLYRGYGDLAKAIAEKKQELDIFEGASLGRTKALESLLRDASAINAYSKDGFTALHFACYFGQPEAARLLIENGARVDAVASNPTKVMPLHSAASSRNLEAARLLLSHGAPINARQQGGWVPLHAAAQNGDRDMVALFLEHKADVVLANDNGKTAAMVAREEGHTQVADVLEHRTTKSSPPGTANC
ncbi:MAG TPA: ankyrin repeat domain-containing protein [Terriglobales bacterium]|jgi:ankyrin repeat protein|nr:ankyrin repeat domain-containing protein [Terriglobales bacterium]